MATVGLIGYYDPDSLWHQTTASETICPMEASKRPILSIYRVNLGLQTAPRKTNTHPPEKQTALVKTSHVRIRELTSKFAPLTSHLDHQIFFLPSKHSGVVVNMGFS